MGVYVTYFYLLAAFAALTLKADAFAIGLFCEEGQDHCECTDFACWCAAGYESADDRNTCRDHNECACGHHTCEEEDICLNTEGSFVCITPEHVVGILEDHQPSVFEDDVGDCLRGEDHCFCKNKYCECEDGYKTEDNNTSCLDIDECACLPYPCGMYELCINTHGSYACLEAEVILEMIAEEEDKKEGEEATTEQSESDESEDEITAELSEQEDESSVVAKSPTSSVENEDQSTPSSETSDSIEEQEDESSVVAKSPTLSVEEDEDSEDSEETNDNVKFHFLDRQYTCEEHPGDVHTCRVCIGVYGHVTENLTVNVTTVGSSAEGEQDYRSVHTQVTFVPGGPIVLCINIQILPDDDQEGSEIFIIELDYQDDCDETKFDSTTVVITDSCSETMEINFTHTNYTVNEGAGVVSVCVLMNGERINKHVRIYTAALGGKHALDTADFHPLSFQIDCGEVEDRYCFDIKIEDDSYPEDDESFAVYLTGMSSCIVSDRSLAVVKIIDNDVAVEEDIIKLENRVEFKFMSRQYTCEEKSDELSSCQVCVGAYGLLYYSASVNVSTIEGSADNDDFQDFFTTMTFNPGDNRIQCINNIQILPNSEQEGNEVFVVQLDSVDACDQHHTDSASVMIVDSCGQVTTVNFAHATYIVGEGEGTVSVCVVLSGDRRRHKEFTIATATMDGSALADIDFKPKRDIVDCGETDNYSYCTDITIRDDVSPEENETFMVYITDLSSCMECIIQSSIITIIDND